ncbi:hypothetical protein ACFQ0K_19480 [Nocardioides caeni]|uniref:Uncharacterized protein n=1 Tax=Nocardioides caeni TaxID=574700 RepID=A0A4V6T5Y9_9ACTN|nr:hypothetical protein [Nocardioides caeni]THV14806.1 hypothetical protein E9934_09190 [Nocardioides caeni]
MSDEEKAVGEPEWKRRRRLDAVFGDGLPDTTSDERDERRPQERESASDQWLKSQVPPHHGG